LGLLVSIEELAKQTMRFSGSDLHSLCRHAALIFATEQASHNGAAPAHFMLDTRHFSKALERTKPSVSEQMLKEIEEFARQFNPRTAGKRRLDENEENRKSKVHAKICSTFIQC
jgi:hypothetical protein